MQGHFTHEQLKKVVIKYLDPLEILGVSNGMSSYTYKIITKDKNYYLSIAKDFTLKFKPKFVVLKLLAEEGVKVPIPVANEDFSELIEGRSFIICSEVKGKSLDEMGSIELKNILFEVGKDLVKVHTIKIKKGFGYLNKLDDNLQPIGELDSYYKHLGETVRYEDTLKNKLNVLLENKVLDGSDISSLESYIEGNKDLLDLTEGVLTHGDFSFEHIFADDGNYTGIIDWEGATSGSPFYDLAQFSSTRTQEEFNFLLEGYFRESNLKKDEDFEKRLILERVIYCIGKIAKGYLMLKNGQIYEKHSKYEKVLIEDISNLKI